jgi:urease accessory protein
MSQVRPLRVGVAGPVGTGKSSLVAAVCGALNDRLQIGVITNDTYTDEDARFLRATGVLRDERIVAVQTGCCPHTAIRDDVSENLNATEELDAATGPLDLIFVESSGDNLTATISPALADVQIFVLDCVGGDDVPRKGGPGIARSDLLVINKVDLAPFVGANVTRMLSDSRVARDGRAVFAISLREPRDLEQVSDWVLEQLAAHRAGELVSQEPRTHGAASPSRAQHSELGSHAHAH